MDIILVLSVVVLVLNIFFSLSLIFIERKDPTTTWAWLLILLVLPGLGFMIYVVLGQNLSRQKIFKEKIKVDQDKRKNINDKYESNIHYHDGGERFLDLRRMNLNHSGAKYTTNNNVKVYIDGEDKFKQLIEDIRNAKRYIHMQYYIFKNDILGKAIIKELTKKAACGLEVRLLVDSMGSRNLTKKALEKYLNCGGKFSIFFPGILPHINTRINYRNHRKIVVIDGEYGYVGGFNVGKEYINKDPKVGFWRDTHVKIEGEAVDDLNERFLLDWCYAAQEEIDDYDKYSLKDRKTVGDVGIQIVTSGPDHKEEYIRNAYIKLINNAKQNVYLETPYLVPDSPILESLRISALSGVDVRIIIPGKPDHFFMQWAASSYIGELLEAGIKIYRYQNGFIHAKTIVADSAVISIGTANMDIRSFKLNFEVNAFIYDDRIAKEGEMQFMKDIKDSEQLTKEVYDNRSFSIRIKESLIRLVSPIL
ncbi:major cardiolipin synthase ClsA [Clostridium saccharobutylicum]|uniref:cardiolipin synthase n=1 Tax=Clostridium saccharobutylicum TaxID=169679 RepID=UPI000983BAAA|nr:cardiolipin synthase [Clostridium saccharobutylicum]AQS08592.1 major cardiolipin synthase ClsA [Clostridium saccharobutylicum]MBC2436063.1 cardiolipin synthase [Clostridium saccharobutylicum]NSB87837.1 cardiolipin synthase [Clostridium saccharobutylicum]NYC29069.1 cardiolipin synthase [Clostridium saccharobutylicum]OOM13294.1 major cardiolipin synthase ClsA [Clostridium saccharobutylicum]